MEHQTDFDFVANQPRQEIKILQILYGLSFVRVETGGGSYSLDFWHMPLDSTHDSTVNLDNFQDIFLL